MNIAAVDILVADHDPQMRGLLASVLRGHGFPFVHFASNGTEAMHLIGGRTPSVRIAFLEIDMPGLSGIEIMKNVKRLELPCLCVVVSAHSAIENVKAAFLSGARGFVVKPFNAQKVVELLRGFERDLQ